MVEVTICCSLRLIAYLGIRFLGFCLSGNYPGVQRFLANIISAYCYCSFKKYYYQILLFSQSPSNYYILAIRNYSIIMEKKEKEIGGS